MGVARRYSPVGVNVERSLTTEFDLFVQVEQLIVVNDAKYRENARLRSLVPAAQRVESATDRLTLTAKRVATDSGDEVKKNPENASAPGAQARPVGGMGTIWEDQNIGQLTLKKVH